MKNEKNDNSILKVAKLTLRAPEVLEDRIAPVGILNGTDGASGKTVGAAVSPIIVPVSP